VAAQGAAGDLLEDDVPARTAAESARIAESRERIGETPAAELGLVGMPGRAIAIAMKTIKSRGHTRRG
jgi:hypothetical protein